MKLFPGVLAAMVLLATQVSYASIIVTGSNNPQSGQENVLLNLNSSGTTVFGSTNQSGTQISFNSLTSLTETSNGQAFGTASGSGFKNLQISSNGNTFTSLILALTLVGNGTSCTNCVSFSAWSNEPDGGSATVQGGNFSLGPGNNFFTVIAQNGETLNNVAILSTTGLATFGQVRVGGVAALSTTSGGGTTGGGVSPVPEPSTYALLGCGVGLLLIGRRKAIG